MSDNTTPPFNDRMVVGSTTTAPATRRLAAILLADVVGYSGMMSRDEDGTHARVARDVRQLIDLNIRRYGGRFARSTGDGTLVEFGSALDAVRCGLDIQRGLTTRQVDESDQIQLRIGINTGDVLADDRDIYGNSVNIAARLQTLATPGTVYVSQSIYDQTRSQPDLFFVDRGKHRVKNISYPIHVFEVAFDPLRASSLARHLRKHVGLAIVMVVVAALAAPASTILVDRSQNEKIREGETPASLPNKHSIAVLPFLNISSDPEQEYFSDGMTEDLITELSRLKGLFVIARNSVYTFKGRAVKAEQVSRELGVRYVVEGSVRKADNRVRITAQLIDAKTGYHAWAQYYDRDLHDVFAVQAEIARMITSALAVKLTKDEEKYMGRPYTSSEVAWEYFMRGAELFRRFTPKDNANARDLFEQAIGLDPKFARAYAILAATHRQDYYGRWSQDPQSSEDLAYRMAQKSVELARSELEPKPSLPFALEQMGWVLLYREKYQEARQAAEEVIQLNPNYADGYAFYAQILVYLGEPEEALHRSQEAIDRNPIYPFFYDYHRGQAYYVWGVLTSTDDPKASRQHFEMAEMHLREALRKNDNFRPARSYLVAVLSELGRQDEAVNEMNISFEKGEPLVKILKSGNQQLADEHIRNLTPYANQEIRRRLTDAWLKAAR